MAQLAQVHGRPTSSCQLFIDRVSSLGLPGGDPGQPGDEKEHAHIERFVAWRGTQATARPALIGGSYKARVLVMLRRECVVPALPGEQPCRHLWRT